MPVVPFTPAAGGRQPSLPTPDDPWVLMAAAQMDAEGRLVESPPQEPSEPKKVGDNG